MESRENEYRTAERFLTGTWGKQITSLLDTAVFGELIKRGGQIRGIQNPGATGWERETDSTLD